MRVLQGTGVSPGVNTGKPINIERTLDFSIAATISLDEGIKELTSKYKSIIEKYNSSSREIEAEVLDAYILILNDPELINSLSELNEANELLMTEMIQKGIFKDIAQDELLSILSIFCDDFDKENEYYINDLVVSDNCKDKLNQIKSIHNDLLNSTSEFCIQYQPEISLQFTDIVWLWCNNKPFSEIIEEYAIFEGNFIKNMQKIHNIVQELNTVAEILEDHELLKKIQNIETLIIKDIVDAKSLYLI